VVPGSSPGAGALRKVKVYVSRYIDIVVPTLVRNHQWLVEAIESVIHESEVKNIFLVVDQSAKKEIKNLRHFFTKSKVKIIESSGTGIASGVNTGIMNVESDYIGRLDDDDISRAGRFKLQIDQIEHYNCDLTFSSLNFMDPIGNISHQIAHEENDGPFWKDSLVLGNFLNHSTLVGKTSFIRSTGLYPLDVRSEDYGFWLQIAQRCEIRTIKKELYTYRQHPSQYTKNRIKSDSNFITYSLWKEYLLQSNFKNNLTTIENYKALHEGAHNDNNVFEIFLQLIERLYHKDTETKNLWSRKLLNKIIDTHINVNFINKKVNENIKELLIEKLFEAINVDRQRMQELGKIGFDLQNQLKDKDDGKKYQLIKLYKKLKNKLIDMVR
jgi:hypothetical protein